MDIETVNVINRIIASFTPEQIETCSKDAEWQNESWHHGHVVGMLAKVLPACGRDALNLALESSVDEFDVALYNLVSKAVTYQRALDMHNYRATFDEVA